YLLACAAVFLTMGFFMWAFAQWEALTFSIVALLSLPMALTAAYTLYLWLVSKTAMLVVTEHGLVYTDRWVRRALLWSEVDTITRFSIRSRKRRGIALRLGLKAIENWQDLLNIAREFSDARISV
ncbi:MAG: hypothetical protein ACK4I8_09365, partial [Armatimonadota bacterium]